MKVRSAAPTVLRCVSPRPWLGGDGGPKSAARRPIVQRNCGLSHDFRAPFARAKHTTPGDMSMNICVLFDRPTRGPPHGAPRLYPYRSEA